MIAPDRFRAARDAGRPSEAWAVAYPLWARTRHPAVGDALAALDLPFDAPPCRTRDEMQAAWLAVARSGPGPAALGWLAEHLADRLPQISWRTHGLYVDRNQPLFERLAALEALPADPRLTDALCGMLERPSNYDVDGVLAPIVRRLTRDGDPRATPRLQALAARPSARHAGVRAWITSAAGAWRPPAHEPVDDEAGWRALTPPPLPAPADPGALLDAVYADPDDDGARWVLADALAEAGDPRGEFVALQLAGGDEAEKAAAKLLRAHKDAWLGPELSAVLVNVEFRRGFLYSAELGQNARADASIWRAAAADPRLATLVRLRKGRGNTEHYTAFVTSPRARALREVDVPGSAVLGALQADPRPALHTLVFPSRPSLATLRSIATSPALSGVRGLAAVVEAAKIDAFWKDLRASKLLDRLESLRVEQKLGLFPSLSAAAPVGKRFAPAVFEPALALPGLRHVALGRPDQVLELVRSPDGRIRARAAGYQIAQALELAPWLTAGAHLELDARDLLVPEAWLETHADALRRAAPGLTVEIRARAVP